jgi:hypothetical protein
MIFLFASLLSPMSFCFAFQIVLINAKARLHIDFYFYCKNTTDVAFDMPKALKKSARLALKRGALSNNEPKWEPVRKLRIVEKENDADKSQEENDIEDEDFVNQTVRLAIKKKNQAVAKFKKNSGECVGSCVRKGHR